MFSHWLGFKGKNGQVHELGERYYISQRIMVKRAGIMRATKE
jgi:hypothetical protein